MDVIVTGAEGYTEYMKTFEWYTKWSHTIEANELPTDKVLDRPNVHNEYLNFISRYLRQHSWMWDIA